MDERIRRRLRSLPAVDHLLRHPAIAGLLDQFPRSEVSRSVREVLDQRRAALAAGREPSLDVRALALDVRQRLHERRLPGLRRVINATGIVLHTGLGRAPLAQEAADAVAELAGGYCNLELDLATGKRGDRHAHVRGLLRELTGAEDALVVNNNAAATYLVLNTLARGRDVVVSRGQLVEIGGSFRMPDVMAAAGCRLVEVGTTNRTRLADFERAIDADTALLLRVHTSNYRICGFVEETPLVQLVGLARGRGLFVVDDLGSGLLCSLTPPEVSGTGGDERAGAACGEPVVRDSVKAGADAVLFSGDKLLGGPQAGIVVGRAACIEPMRQNPMLRVLRPDKLTLAALEATLRLYRDRDACREQLPAHRMLLRGEAELRGEAQALCDAIRANCPGVDVEVTQGVSEAGGGSLPGVRLPTWVVVSRAVGSSAAELAAALRAGETPVICRVARERLVFDPRTLLAGDAEAVVAALAEALRETSRRC